MTTQQQIKIKLNIIREFRHLNFTLIEVYDILDDLKREIGNLAIEQELKRMKIKRMK